jgi:thiol-disulfide isomerase/thioredoxin
MQRTRVPRPPGLFEPRAWSAGLAPGAGAARLAGGTRLVGLALLALCLGTSAGRAADAGSTSTSAGAGPRAGKAAAPARRPAPRFVSTAEVHETIAGQRGRVVLLHLWATWCLPCLDELPVVAAFARVGRERGVSVVSISLDDATPRARAYVDRLLRKRAANLDNVILKTDDPDAFIASIDPKWEGTIPAFFAYDDKGRLRRAHIGIADAAALERLVDGLHGTEPRR